MTSTTLADIHGTVRVASDDVHRFVRSWFKYDYKVCLVLRKPNSSRFNEDKSFSSQVADLATMTDEDLSTVIFSLDNGRNAYITPSPIIKDVDVKASKRGGEENVQCVLGTWADLDVKEGSFSSQEEIVGWLHSLEAPPSIMVGSGSGGVHAYWRLKDGEYGSKELLERWWSYLDEKSGERSIDRLIDSARIMRLPGTVYFPKSGSKVGKTVLLETTGVEYSKETLIGLSAESYRKKIMARRETVRADTKKREQAENYLTTVLGGENQWQTLQAAAFLEDYVNEHLTWDEILEPNGWTFNRVCGDGSREFTRPGPDPDRRSATVDYEDSPVMSLLTESEYTGLADLKEAGVVLTKYRVALRLLFGDDPQMMIDTLIPDMKRAGVI